jgi:FKBP-type peptidyl-prolyl cis-trans isomerase FklB
MKFNRLILFAGAGLLWLASCQTQKPVASASTTPTPAVQPRPDFALRNLKDSISYSIGVSIGNGIKSQGIDSLNIEILSKAIDGAYKSDSLLISPEEANAFLSSYFQNLQMKKAEAGKAAGQKFMEENKTKPGVITLPSGLQYQVLKEGTGPKPKATDKVTAHYRGTLSDGTVFDSSYDRNQPLNIGVSEVIPGWTEALQLMKVGSKWKLFIPSDLGYGERGAGHEIPPHSPLVFEMELLSIDQADKKESDKKEADKKPTKPKK